MRPSNDSTLRSACWPKAGPLVSCRDGTPMTQGPGPDTLVPIFGMITGVITTGLFFLGIVKLAQSQVGSALARRIQGHSGGVEAEFAAELNYLRDQVDGLRADRNPGATGLRRADAGEGTHTRAAAG